MENNTDFSRKMTADEIKDSAQKLYDKLNWEGLSHHEHLMMVGFKVNYLEMTGKPLELTYNCPA